MQLNQLIIIKYKTLGELVLICCILGVECGTLIDALNLISTIGILFNMKNSSEQRRYVVLEYFILYFKLFCITYNIY